MSNFLEEISSLSQSIVFLCFLALFTLRRLTYLSFLFFGTLHLDGCIFHFILCLLLLFFPRLICKVSSDNHFALLHFFFLGMVLITTFCTTLRTSVHSSVHITIEQLQVRLSACGL